MYDFKAEDEGELSVSAGQMVLLSGTYGVYLLVSAPASHCWRGSSRQAVH
jgi:hypothetical protein